MPIVWEAISEWGFPVGHGIMSALFVEGRVGQGSYHGVWGGLRVYFGKSDKTLIRRHREDDPNGWNDGPASVFGNGSSSGSQTNAPAGPPSCPVGQHLHNGACVPNL